MHREPPRRLLVLDDDDLVGMLVAAIGRSAGLHTRLTTDHASFFLELQDFQPDFILLDLTMPSMPGEDVILLLAQQRCNARIIICSGVAPERLAEAATVVEQCGLLLGGTLLKPFKPAALRYLLNCA